MADETVRLGVIGLGGRGRYFARNYDTHPEAELVAVADPDAQALERVRPAYGDRIDYYSDLEELLSREDVPAVVIASPDFAHRDNAVQAFEYGKHVMLEKPMAQSVEDTDDIIRAWNEAGTVPCVGLELRYSAIFVRMREILDAGKIGEVQTGMAVDNVSVGGNYFYHDQQRLKSYTVSLLMQKGVHTIDLLNWLMDAGRPTKVYATGSLAYYGGDAPNDKRCRDCQEAEDCPFFIEPERFQMDYDVTIEKQDLCVFAEEADVNDNSQVIITYESGKSAVYTECHFTPEYTRDFWLTGDAGKMYAQYNNECNFVIRNRYRHTEHIDEWHPRSTGGGHGGGDPLIQQAFLDWVREPERMDVSMALDARHATCVGAAGERSIETGMPVEIPPPPEVSLR
ncbi:MAG: Gfo/Idh/MocA family oxidoreductase [Armatimonadota bacterium]|nr:Gfo/Idh/MocA family oxidoreductase [Armatimonadota bacterium]